MKKNRHVSMKDLQRRRRESLEKAEKAIASRPGEYLQIKRLLAEILSRPVEVGEYHRIARRLTGLLEQLNAGAPDSLFAYYYDNLAPERQGDARYFKMVCTDLNEQIRHVDKFRRQRHNLRIIQ